MLVYYSILCILIYLGLLKKIGKKYIGLENVIVIIASILLFVFAALRSIEIGADTHQYIGHFLKISETKIRDLGTYSYSFFGDIETGYKFYNKLLSFFEHQQTITIANSLLQILLISILIFKSSKDKWLSIFLYFTFCFYQTALNLTPSSFVSYFIFLAFPFIKEKKAVAYLLFILIGMTFHTSAIFFLPLYFLSKIKITPPRIIIILAISATVMIFYSSFLPVILKIVPSKYAFYIDSNTEHKQLFSELLVYAVQLCAIIFCFLLLNDEKRFTFINDNPVMCWAFLFETILYMLSTQSAMFSRGAFLFSPYTIIMIPQLLESVESSKKKDVGKLCIVVYGIIIYIARVHVNNVGTTMPYKFFFT